MIPSNPPVFTNNPYISFSPIPSASSSAFPFSSTASGSILNGLYGGLQNYFTNFNYHALIHWLEIIGLILTIIFGALFLFAILKLSSLTKEKIAEKELEIEEENKIKPSYDARWDHIRNAVQSVNSNEWKLAVIEGDKYVDDALKKSGFQGETMGERLMLIEPGQLLSLQTLWDAHKLRNLLVHDANYQMTHRQAVLAIEAFEKVLRELGMLS